MAGHSCEEEEEGEVKEEEREPSLFSSSTLRGPAATCDMSGEVNHGDKKAQCNGVKKHRWDQDAVNL